MTDFTIHRSGQPPLRFRGTLIAESDGKWHTGKDQNRWHDLCVYRTAGGKYVVQITYRTMWQGETEAYTAVVLNDPADVARVFREYDPCEAVQGFPPNEAFAEKQRRLLADLRRRFDAQVSDVLGSEEFAERVE